MSSFQGVGIEEFHCIQRCPHFRGWTHYQIIRGCWPNQHQNLNLMVSVYIHLTTCNYIQLVCSPRSRVTTIYRFQADHLCTTANWLCLKGDHYIQVPLYKQTTSVQQPTGCVSRMTTIYRFHCINNNSQLVVSQG